MQTVQPQLGLFKELSTTVDSHLVLELLTELQGDGEEDQRVVEPRHHTLHFVNMAHLEAIVVELAVDANVHNKKQSSEASHAFAILTVEEQEEEEKQQQEEQDFFFFLDFNKTLFTQ